MKFAIGEVLLSLIHPFVYFSLPDSLTGLLVIISSLGTHISIKAILRSLF